MPQNYGETFFCISLIYKTYLKGIIWSLLTFKKFHQKISTFLKNSLFFDEIFLRVIETILYLLDMFYI